MHSQTRFRYDNLVYSKCVTVLVTCVLYLQQSDIKVITGQSCGIRKKRTLARPKNIVNVLGMQQVRFLKLFFRCTQNLNVGHFRSTGSSIFFCRLECPEVEILLAEICVESRTTECLVIFRKKSINTAGKLSSVSFRTMVRDY